MPFRYIIIPLIVLIVMLLNFQVKALPPITYLSIDQGLSNNSVRCIYQDHRGFMWIGTYDGLNRYDGYSFKVFRNNFRDTSSLVNNYIFSIDEDKQSNMWIGTHGGACVYNNYTGKFTAVKYLPKEGGPSKKIIVGTRVIKIDARENILIGTLGKGLMLKTKNGAVATQIPVVVSGRELWDYDVQAIKSDDQGRVWIIIPQIGLCTLDYTNKKVIIINSLVKNGFCLVPDVGKIWIGTTQGLYLYQEQTNTVTRLFSLNTGKLVSDMVLDTDKQLWIAINGGGVMICNTVNKTIVSLHNDYGYNPLSNDAAYAIFKDKENRFWVGTLNGGLSIIDPQKDRFKIIAHDPANPQSLPKNSIYAIYEQDSNHIWVGTDNGGLAIWNRKTNTFTHYINKPENPSSLSDNIVTNIIGDSQKNIWIGTFFGGVNKFNKNSKTFEHYKCINSGSHLENQVISTMCLDGRDHIWVGTFKGGGTDGALYLFNPARNSFDCFDTSLSDLYCLTNDLQGNLWAGMLTQLVEINRETKKHSFFELGNYLRSIYEDKKKNFWIGTEGGGLILFDRTRSKIVARYTMEDGLCNNSVLNILGDKEGNLWLSTFNGLSKFNPQTKTFKNYYKSDGLQSNQFHYISKCSLQSGELVFGGIEGINIFYPEKIIDFNGRPQLILSGLSVDNFFLEKNASYVKKAISDVIEEIEVPYAKASFIFDYTALEYTAPDKIKYAYYMEGWDHDWTYSGSGRSAHYTHIDEGNYTFRVKCTNAEGKWMGTQISLNIHVLAPWYRSLLAYMLYALTIGTIIYIYYYYKSRQARLKFEIAIASANMEVEKAEKGQERAEREKISAELDLEKAEHEKDRILNEKEKELNDKRLSFFTNVSHEFRTPLTLIINPAKVLLEKTDLTEKHVDNEIKVIYRNARRMLSLVDQLLHFRKADISDEQIFPGRLNFYILCQEVYLCFIQQASFKHIKYSFDCANQNLELYGDRSKLEIILYNLISNALKFTPNEGEVAFSITEEEDRIIVNVTDTGPGIRIDEGEQIFDKFYQSANHSGSIKPGFGIGLYLVKHFAEAHFAEISYTSEAGSGTTFTLSLLKGSDHYIGLNSIKHSNLIEGNKDDDELSVINSFIINESIINENTNPTNPFDLELFTERKSMLVADDDKEIREYIADLFSKQFNIYQAESGEEGLDIAKQYLPDVIISDIKMQGMSGIDLCKCIKQDQTTAHIPVILLTGTSSSELKLQGVEGGADDYITKPFDSEYLLARVTGLLKSRNNLQNYFYNRITHQNIDAVRVSAEYKEFIEKCIAIVEKYIDDSEFNISTLIDEIGMSHSNLYRKVKSVSGVSVTAFIRLIRLRKAAELMLKHDYNINEISAMIGFNSPKYFRTQFQKVFGMKPSIYIKQFRNSFRDEFALNSINFKTHKK